MEALNAPQTQPIAAPASQPGLAPYAGGILRMMSNAQLDAESRRTAEQANNQPVIQGLAGHVRQFWTVARQAKMMTVEERMLRAVRQRRGEYDPEVLAEIRKGGGSEIYMMLTSNKCRAAGAWLRDVMLGTGAEKPWSIQATPVPDLPPVMAQSVAKLAFREAQTFQEQTGNVVGEDQMEEVVQRVRDRILTNARKRAKEATERMERQMEDQLLEGGFHRALAAFIEDLVTFPTAVLKGPVVRKKPKLKWSPDAQDQFKLDITDTLVLEWERVDPFMVYPSPAAATIQEGDLIQRHHMTREGLNALIGVEGYNTEAIRAVLDEYGRGGLKDWLYIDSAKADAEGRSLSAVFQNPEGTIDALQYWGTVQGKLLVEWGMAKEEVPDPLRDYPCEVWLIGRWVIKAMLNPDPLGRRPYYTASYEEVPGVFWGNSVPELCRDSQLQCNTAARAIANNMNIASGPQVQVNVDRLPAGEDVTQVYPWKVWQTTSDPYGNTTQPAVDFFSPKSVAGELMNIYIFFSNLADEHSGVPRYMTGDAQVGGAGRTASGMSMLMNNAGKAIKQVVANVDMAIKGAIERLYFYNMRYGTDPALKGDVNIRALGAESIIVKEQAQVRTNEFLGIVMSNPMITKIVGEEAIARLLRHAARKLDMDTDELVPPPEVIRARIYKEQVAQGQAQRMAMQMQSMPQSELRFKRTPEGMEEEQTINWQHAPLAQPAVMPPGMPGVADPSKIMPGNEQSLENGAPITDNFAPMRG
jgi:hypothetical protein